MTTIIVEQKVVDTMPQMRASNNSGPLFGSSYKKDHTKFGSIMGPPVYGNPQIQITIQKLGVLLKTPVAGFESLADTVGTLVITNATGPFSENGWLSKVWSLFGSLI